MRDALPAQSSAEQDNSVTAAASLDLVSTYFDFLDRDQNQYLTEEEARVKPHYLWHLNLKDRMTMAAFSNVVDSVQHLSNDELFTEDDGVTKEDLKMLRENLSDYPDIEAVITKNLPDPDVEEKPYVPKASSTPSATEPPIFGNNKSDSEDPNTLFIMDIWKYL